MFPTTSPAHVAPLQHVPAVKEHSAFDLLALLQHKDLAVGSKTPYMIQVDKYVAVHIRWAEDDNKVIQDRSTPGTTVGEHHQMPSEFKWIAAAEEEHAKHIKYVEVANKEATKAYILPSQPLPGIQESGKGKGNDGREDPMVKHQHEEISNSYLKTLGHLPGPSEQLPHPAQVYEPHLQTARRRSCNVSNAVRMPFRKKSAPLAPTAGKTQTALMTPGQRLVDSTPASPVAPQGATGKLPRRTTVLSNGSNVSSVSTRRFFSSGVKAIKGDLMHPNTTSWGHQAALDASGEKILDPRLVKQMRGGKLEYRSVREYLAHRNSAWIYMNAMAKNHADQVILLVGVIEKGFRNAVQKGWVSDAYQTQNIIIRIRCDMYAGSIDSIHLRFTELTNSVMLNTDGPSIPWNESAFDNIFRELTFGSCMAQNLGIVVRLIPWCTPANGEQAIAVCHRWEHSIKLHLEKARSIKGEMAQEGAKRASEKKAKQDNFDKHLDRTIKIFGALTGTVSSLAGLIT